MGEQPQVKTDLFRVRHVTRYRYARPVKFGRHRAMFRPHETPELRLLTMAVDTKPEAAVHWIHDVFSNSVTLFDFNEPSDVLEVGCTFDILRTTFRDADFPIAEHARSFPFEYEDHEKPDLAACRSPRHDDPDGAVDAFARRFEREAGGDTWSLLTTMTRAIKAELSYQRREEPGVQDPAQTLSLGSGSCRDYAELMCELTRRLGFAARFVTGYLYDPALDARTADAPSDVQGAGATHAWTQVFLPGAGWIEFDPTNGDVASGALIRTGVGRVPSQVAPLTGFFDGRPQDALGLEVSVDITTLAPPLTQ
ncbi:MAG: transglutaminase family protein [Oceanicaulis sp.]